MQPCYQSDCQFLQNRHEYFLLQYVFCVVLLFFICDTVHADEAVNVKPAGGRDSVNPLYKNEKPSDVVCTQNTSDDCINASSSYEMSLVVFFNKNLSSEESLPDDTTPASPSESAIILKDLTQFESMNKLKELTDETMQKKEVTINKNNQTFKINDNSIFRLPENKEFSKIISSLEKTPTYQVLYSARWRMPVNISKKFTFAVCPDSEESGGLCGEISVYKKRFFILQPI